MAQLWMIRELARLKVDFTSVDINNSYATHSKLSNKSQTPGVAEENNLWPTQASNNTNAGGETAIPSICIHYLGTAQNWSSLAMPVRTLLECDAISTAYFIDYFDDPVPDGAVIYAGDVPFQYNEQEGMCTEFLGNPTGNIF